MCEASLTLLSSQIIFDADEPLPAKAALEKIKVNKATGPDNIPPWVFLLDREQRVKIGNAVPGCPNGGVPQGNLSDQNNFGPYQCGLRTPCPI